MNRIGGQNVVQAPFPAAERKTAGNASAPPNPCKLQRRDTVSRDVSGSQKNAAKFAIIV